MQSDRQKCHTATDVVLQWVKLLPVAYQSLLVSWLLLECVLGKEEVGDQGTWAPVTAVKDTHAAPGSWL